MVNHPTENKGKWDTIDLTAITNGKVKTIAQGVASTKKWHDENPDAYKNGGRISSWEIIEDVPQFQGGGKTNPPIYVNDPKDPRLQRYNDSLDLFKSYQQLKTNLNKQGYESAHIPSSMIMKEKDIINYAEGRIKGANLLSTFDPTRTLPKQSSFDKVSPVKVREHIYSILDMVPGQINPTLGKQLISDIIKPKSVDSYAMPFFSLSKYQNDGRIVYNYENVNPKQPFIFNKKLSPITTTTSKLTPSSKLIPNKSKGFSGVMNLISKKDGSILNTDYINYKRQQKEITPMNVMGLETLIPSQTMQKVPVPNPITSIPKDYYTIKTGSSYRNPETGAFEQQTFLIDKVTGKRITEPAFQNGGQTKSNWEILEDTNKDYEYKNGGKTPAWQRKEGKSPSGGLNAKGRASLKKEGHDIKPPQPEGGSRKKSFCARMTGMKKKLTGSKKANDPNSRINLSLKKWKC